MLNGPQINSGVLKICLVMLMVTGSGLYPAEAPFYRQRKIFQAGEYGPQCHSSTIAEASNGDLLAAWWSGSYEGARDVVIKVARLPRGAEKWERSETVADFPGVFEGNPVLFSLPDGRIFLFFARIESRGPEGLQIMYSVSSDLGHIWAPVKEFVTRRGIRTRNHPIVMPNGEILFPLHDQADGSSVFLISGDGGATWDMTGPVVSEPGNIQPTVVSRGNGELYALMRTWNEEPDKRFLWQSESHDYGRTWSSPVYSRIPSVSSAIEMTRLENGHIVLAFNDGRERARTPLNLALSVDNAQTWSYNRALEKGIGRFAYPAIIQTRDGHIHVTYSYNRQYIKHVEVNEAWIKMIPYPAPPGTAIFLPK